MILVTVLMKHQHCLLQVHSEELQELASSGLFTFLFLSIADVFMDFMVF